MIHIWVPRSGVTEKAPPSELVGVFAATLASTQIVFAALHQIGQFEDQLAARFQQPAPFAQHDFCIPAVKMLEQVDCLHHICASILKRNLLSIAQHFRITWRVRIARNIAVEPAVHDSRTAADVDFHAVTFKMNFQACAASSALHYHHASRFKKFARFSGVNSFPASHCAAPSSHSKGTPAITASTAQLLCRQTTSDAPCNACSIGAGSRFCRMMIYRPGNRSRNSMALRSSHPSTPRNYRDFLPIPMTII